MLVNVYVIKMGDPTPSIDDKKEEEQADVNKLLTFEIIFNYFKLFFFFNYYYYYFNYLFKSKKLI